MLLNGYIIPRPEKTKLQSRKGDKSNLYVYHVLSQEYQKDKQYVVEKRVCIGKMLDTEANTMIPNEKFSLYYPELMPDTSSLPEPPVFSDVLKAGGCLAIQSILKDEGLHDILKNVYGEEIAADIENILTYVTLSQSASFQHYPAFMRNHLSQDGQIRSDSHISTLLTEDISTSTIMDTLRQWNKKHNKTDCVYIGYDSTNFNTCSNGITFAEYGKAKDDPSLKQVNFSMAVSQKDTTPLFYELYKGSIVDLSQCDRMVEQMSDFGYENVGFILDRGYCTVDNIKYLDSKNYDFMMMMKSNSKVITDMIKEHASEAQDISANYLPDAEVSSITVKGTLFQGDTKTRNFHIYFDERRASDSRLSFAAKLAQMEKSLKSLVGTKLRANENLDDFKEYFSLNIRTETKQKKTKDQNGKTITIAVNENFLESYEKKMDKIKDHLNSLGFFVIITTREHTAEEALLTYRGRDNVEKLFRSIKSGMDFDTPSVHSDKALVSKIHLMFLSAIIWNRLLQISRDIKQECNNKKDFTVPGIIDQLEAIECIRKSSSGYFRNYALTAKQKKILERLAITESDIDVAINNFSA